MDDNFSTNHWVDVVSNRLKSVKERQAKLVKEMESCGVIKKIRQGEWEKTGLSVVDELIKA